MHALGRCVRFSVNPFLSQESGGFNAFASKPAGEGLSIFLELGVEVTGEVERSTGFVVNVSEIDRIVRECAVPIFAERIRGAFGRGRHVGPYELADMLRSAQDRLSGKFGTCRVNRLTLKLSPFRNMTMDSREPQMVYFGEKFEFAATHKLWNSDFSPERNFQAFGKCANPSGHGHNYVVEVTIKRPAGENGFCVADFERIVDERFIQLVDHKNLNEDVAEFGRTNPTIENIAVFAWKNLAGQFGPATGGLHCVTVWESERTYCSYYG